MNESGPDQIDLVYGWAGVGVIAVVFHNTSSFFHDHPVPGVIVSTFLDAGWVGIPLLLLLAGFVATGVLRDSTASSGFRSGLYARFLGRAVPLYYLTLIVAFGLLPHVLEPSAWTESVTRDQFWYWMLLKNWVPATGPQISGFEHTWILSDGWPILLIWPVLARFGAWHAAVFVVLASVTWRTGMLLSGAAPTVVYHSAWSWFGAVGVGSLLAVAIRNGAAVQAMQRFRGAALAVTTLALIALVVSRHGLSAGDGVVVGGGVSVVILWFTALIASTMVGSTRPEALAGSFLRLRPIQAIGRHAFAVYLLHFPMHRAFTTVIHPGAVDATLDVGVRLAYAGLVLASSTLLAMMWRQLFEWTVRRLEPLWPGNTPEVGAAEAG